MRGLTWLHLSDLHLPPSLANNYQVDKVLATLIDMLRQDASKGLKPDVIFVTGDIGDKGKDYSKAEQFFDELLDATGLSSELGTEAKRRLYLVPGNHDVDQGETKFLLSTLDTIEEANDFFSPQSTASRQPYFERFHRYADFFNRYFRDIRTFNVDQHYYAEVLDLGDIPIRLGIIGLNSAWFSQGDEDEHKLWIGERVCDEAFKSITDAGGADVTIVLHHHPYAWLHTRDARHVKGLLTEKADICLYGHIHYDETEEIRDQHGDVLRFQAGATYGTGNHPCRALWGILNLESGIVNIRPITYQEGPPRCWTLDTSLYPSQEPNYRKDFHLHRLIRKRTMGMPLCNPVAFFSGGSATYADIAAELDVPRTQYIRTWTDERGVPQKAWKGLMLSQSTDTSLARRIRLVIVYGHMGSGKATLCTRMVYDLKSCAIPVIDLLSTSLSPQHVKDIEVQLRMATRERLHIFTRIEDISDVTVVQQFLAAVKRLADLQQPLTLYVAVDTNKWRQIELKMGNSARIMGYHLESRHLRGQLDDQELEDLISRLKAHHCLFRLEHKTDEMISALFRRKARKGLLTCLIEATRGTEEEQELGEILWREYQGLGEKAQWAYALVALFGAFGITLPYSVMEGALGKLTGDRAYFESSVFNAETSEIVYRPMTASYGTRHRLVAETLLQRFIGTEWDGFKYRLMYAVLHSLVLSIPLHRTFFDITCNRKVFRVIHDMEPLIQDTEKGEIGPVQDRDISRVLNSVIRIYQGRGKYEDGEHLADKSFKHWNHVGNQAYYLRAFCSYHLGKIEEVRRTAIDLVNATNYPFHMLHGITLLRLLRDWIAADRSLKAFEKSVSPDADSYSDYCHLRQEIDRWLLVSVAWSDSNIDSLRPTLALERIEYALVDGGADETTIVEQYVKLIRRQHDFLKAYISFFSYLHRPRIDEDEDTALERYRILQRECEYHLRQHDEHWKQYPKDIRSILHSNLARALFRGDYISKQGYPNQEACDTHFVEAISLNHDSWYAHNWYGTFLKEAMKDRETARTHYELAVNGDKNNPLFKHNLALLQFDAPTFSRKELEAAKELAQQAASLCTEGSNWEDFNHYPHELLIRICLLLERTDLKDGQPLDRAQSLSADVW